MSRTAAVIAAGVALVLAGTGVALAATPHAVHPMTAAKAGAVVSMTQYAPGGAAAVTGSSFAFLGSPPKESFSNAKTAADVTATVDEASADGNGIDEAIGICYEPVGGSTVTEVSEVVPEFVAAEDSYFAQTVSGVVGGLAKGTYYIGLCAVDQTDVNNGAASVTILLAQTTSGVSDDAHAAVSLKQ
ncbi:MAG TPA: hypothetical protein VMF07_01635 [Solirubrobacteraceae bacterium]|nr:hypothetical protein [Solirubrobacteraceae bacterium]